MGTYYKIRVDQQEISTVLKVNSEEDKTLRGEFIKFLDELKVEINF